MGLVVPETCLRDRRFPSPLEVDRFISQWHPVTDEGDILFPSSLEVGRFISVLYQVLHQERVKLLRFRPLSRWIGLYPDSDEHLEYVSQMVTVPSRGG